MMRAKLSGYIEDPSIVFNRYPMTNKTLPARYARAVARFRLGGRDNMDRAVREMDAMIKGQPNNPLFLGNQRRLVAKSRQAP